ncbi:MAG: hypothetical protein ABFR53_11865 [Actinomycetota bacterium]
MDPSVEWNWVLLAYGLTYASLVAFTTSVAVRITKARRKLAEQA